MHTQTKLSKPCALMPIPLMVTITACTLSLIGCGPEKKAEIEPAKITVVELTKDIEAGSKITSEDLGEGEIVEDPENKQFQDEYIKDKKNAEGKIARFNLTMGQQILKSELAIPAKNSIVLKLDGESIRKLYKLKSETDSNIVMVATKILEEELNKSPDQAGNEKDKEKQ